MYIFLLTVFKKKKIFKISRCWQDYSEIGTLFLKTLEISIKRVGKMFILVDQVIFLAIYSEEINQSCPQKVVS